MIVIYHDVGGAHSAATAANIHINKLPMDRIPSKNEQLGHLIYIGEDETKTKIYTLARQYVPNLVIPAITDMYCIFHGSTDQLFIVDTKLAVNFLMKIGGYTSRKLNWVRFGRPIVTKGTQDAYLDIVNIVKGVKSNIKKQLLDNNY